MGVVPIHDNVVMQFWCHCNWFIDIGAFSAACFLCFGIFNKNVICFKFIKNIGKMPLSRQQYREINSRRARRLFFLFMMWRIYSASTRAFWVHPLFEEHRQKGEIYVLYLDLRNFALNFFCNVQNESKEI